MWCGEGEGGGYSHLPKLLPRDPVGVVNLVRDGSRFLPSLHPHERIVGRARRLDSDGRGRLRAARKVAFG